MAREGARESRARRLRDTFEGQFGDYNERQLMDAILLILREKEDLEEQKKASAASFNELIKEKKDALQYCRERYDYVVTQDLEDQADELLADD